MLLKFRRLLKSTALQLVLLNYVQVVISFAASVFFANSLDTNAYGIYCSYLFLAGIVGSLIAFGSDKTLVRDMIQSSAPDRVLIASAYTRLSLFCLALFGVFIFSTFMPNKNELWLLSIAVFIAGATALAPTAAYDVSKQMIRIQLSVFIERLIFVVSAVLILLQRPYQDPVLDVLVLLAINLCMKVMVLAWQWAFCGITFCWPDKNLLKLAAKGFQQNAPVVLAGISALIYMNACPLLLRYTNGSSEVAIYSVAFQFVSLIIICQSQLLRTFIPSISNLLKSDDISTTTVLAEYRRICRHGLMLTGALCAVVFMASAFVITWFYKPEYQPAVLTMLPLLLFAIFYWPAAVGGQFVLGAGAAKDYGRINIQTLSVGLAVGPLLCVYCGASGEAFDICIREFINLFLYRKCLYKIYNVRPTWSGKRRLLGMTKPSKQQIDLSSCTVTKAA